MRAYGHTAIWGTHIGIGHARDAKGWYHELKAWWTAHKTARQEAQLTTSPLRADAATDMVAPVHARSIIMALCHLSV